MFMVATIPAGLLTRIRSTFLRLRRGGSSGIVGSDADVSDMAITPDSSPRTPTVAEAAPLVAEAAPAVMLERRSLHVRLLHRARLGRIFGGQPLGWPCMKASSNDQFICITAACLNCKTRFNLLTRSMNRSSLLGLRGRPCLRWGRTRRASRQRSSHDGAHALRKRRSRLNLPRLGSAARRVYLRTCR